MIASHRSHTKSEVPANTIYKGFVRRGAVVVPETIEEGTDLAEVKSKLLERMRAIQAEDRARGECTELWYTIQGNKDGIWHGCMTKKGGYYEDNNDRIPWWAWVLMIPGFILAPVFWFVYDLFNPSKLKRDREAYWKSRGSDDTTTA